MGKDEEFVFLGLTNLGRGTNGKGVGNSSPSSGVDSIAQHDSVTAELTRESNVGKFGVVSGEVVFVGVDVETIRVEMVSALDGDGNGVEVGLDKGEIVGGLGLEFVGAFVRKIDGGEGIGTRAEVSRSARSVEGGEGIFGDERLEGGVVTVFARVGNVPDTEHEETDGEVEGNSNVGESGVRFGINGEGFEFLNLFNEVFAVSATHLLTFFVGNGDVVHDVSNVTKVESRVVFDPSGVSAFDDVTVLGVIFGDEEVRKVPEFDGSLDFVVGEGSHGESLVLGLIVGVVTGMEPGEGDVEDPRGENEGVARNGARAGKGSVEDGDITNHVGVALSLGGGDGEGSPEVEVVSGEFVHGNFVGSEASTVDESVTNLGGPTDTEAGKIDGIRNSSGVDDNSREGAP